MSATAFVFGRSRRFRLTAAVGLVLPLLADPPAGHRRAPFAFDPENIQAAQAKVAAQNATAQGVGSGYGGAVDGTSGTASGR